VISTIRLAGDFEYRRHAIAFQPAGAATGDAGVERFWEAVEGSYPLGLAEAETAQRSQGSDWVAILSGRSRQLLVSWKVAGHERIDVAESFDPGKRTRVNLVQPRSAVISLSMRLTAGRSGTFTLASLHYASPKPTGMAQIQQSAKRLIERWA
jgi:hypothetical protein